MAGEQLQYKRGAVIYYENKERAELQKFLFFFFFFLSAEEFISTAER